MATIINNPRGETADSTGVGLIIGILVALALIVLFFMYGLPALRGGAGTGTTDTTGASINVNLPTGGESGGTGGSQ